MLFCCFVVVGIDVVVVDVIVDHRNPILKFMSKSGQCHCCCFCFVVLVFVSLLLLLILVVVVDRET